MPTGSNIVLESPSQSPNLTLTDYVVEAIEYSGGKNFQSQRLDISKIPIYKYQYITAPISFLCQKSMRFLILTQNRI